MGTIVVPLPGWKVIRRRIQIRRMDIIQTGRAMKNQTSQLGTGSMFWRAMMFWGEAIGEAAPPMLAARAMPRIRALEKRESEGRLRRRGCRGYGQFYLFTSRKASRCWDFTYLNDRETKYRRCDVADPHACNHRHKHVCKQHGPRLGTGFAQEIGCHELSNVVLGKGSRDSEATEKKHDDRRPHRCKDVLGRILRM